MPLTSDKIQHVISAYQSAYAQYGSHPGSVLIPKGRQGLRFNAVTRHIRNDGFSILDYGCGLSDLKAFLDERFSSYSYTGADAVEEFVEHGRNRFPKAEFLHASDPSEITQTFDHIVLCGAFNVLYAADEAEHEDIVRSIILSLFERARFSLSIDFMTDLVDFKQPKAYHQNLPRLYEFLTSRVSRRLRIDCSYLPYEFAVTIFKDCEIERPANIYARES